MSSPSDVFAVPDGSGVPLDQLAEVLDLAFADEEFQLRNRLVQLCAVPDSPEECELRLLDLEGRHPAAVLDGFVAPPECVALASVGGGWAAPDPSPHSRPSAHPDAVRARIIVVVDRAGRVAARTRLSDGRSFSEPPSTGQVLAGLRRALGLRG